MGYYGHLPGGVLEECSGPDLAREFRSRVCLAWEEEASRAKGRTVLLRFGNILHPSGGVLARLQAIFRRTGVWVLGHPKSRFSWITLEDSIRLVVFTLEKLSGPINATSPNPLTQEEFSRGLGPVRGRAPAWALRSLMGELSSTLLDDQFVVPRAALAAGFEFENAARPLFERSDVSPLAVAGSSRATRRHT